MNKKPNQYCNDMTKAVVLLLLSILIILSACNPQEAFGDQNSLLQNKISPKDTSTPISTIISTPTITPTLTPTPDPIQIKSDIPFISKETMQPYVDSLNKNHFANSIYQRNEFIRIANGYSDVNFEEFNSGEILAKEQAYISKHPPFSGEVNNSGLFLWKMSMIRDLESKENQVAFYSAYWYSFNPTIRFIKLISIYNFEDKEFFDKIGVNNKEYDNFFWLMTWAYQNPSGEVKLIHTIVNSFEIFISSYNKARYFLDQNCHYGNEPIPRFVYDYEFYFSLDEISKNIRLNYLMLGLIYQKHPEIKPDTSLVRKWAETRIFPDELQNKLFGYRSFDCW